METPNTYEYRVNQARDIIREVIQTLTLSVGHPAKFDPTPNAA